MDVELDEPKLIAWSSSSTGRQFLRSQGFRVTQHGGQVNYGRALRNHVVVSRIKGLPCGLAAFRRSCLSSMQKAWCIHGSLFPSALHGCESVWLGTHHFGALGSQTTQAMKWQGAGASQVVRLNLLHMGSLDPGFFQLWRVLSLARRQFLRFDHLSQLWTRFSEALTEAEPAGCGPFAKLREQISQLGWRSDSNLNLWILWDLCIPFLSSPGALLKDLALWHLDLSSWLCGSGRL